MISHQMITKAVDCVSYPKDYTKLLPSIFRLKNAYGHWFDFEMTPYQVEWHNRFILAYSDWDDSPNRLWNKGRGLGATVHTMMDLIMAALYWDGLNIPISSITGEQGDVPIQWGIDLCDNAKVPIRRNEQVNSRLELLDTGSKIFKIPGRSPQNFRSYRTPVIYNDEFDWCNYQNEIIDASDNCMSEGGQRSIVSTVQNSRGLFSRYIREPEFYGYWVLQTPIFDPEKLDPTKDLRDQIHQGHIKPLANWLNVDLLEMQRRKDITKFLRENQCYAPDEEVNFMSWDLISTICSIKPFDDGNPMGYVGDYRIKWTQKQRIGSNPYSLGVDFGRYKDLAVFEVMEHTSFGVIQRYEHVLKGSDTPSQNKLIDNLHGQFQFTIIRIDMTGPGQGLYDYAYQTHGYKVDGVHFSRSVEIGDTTGPARLHYALNLRQLAQNNRIALFDYLELRDDLNSVPYDLSDPRRTEDGSHGDRFWAIALAAASPVDNQPFALYV